MKALIILSLITATIVCISCNKHSSKKSVEKIDHTFEVEYKRGKGRSKSKPAYTIALKGNVVTFNGIANVDVMGEKTFEISTSKYKAIKEAFDSSNFSEFEELYQGRMRDLPMMKLTFKEHTVKYQEKAAPENLAKLGQKMEELLPTK